MFLVPGQRNVRVHRLNHERELSWIEINRTRGIFAYCPITGQYFPEDDEMMTGQRDCQKKQTVD